MQQVIIAEKPSVAKEIATVLGIKDRKDGYITDGKNAVTWAFGHLVQLAQPQDYEDFTLPYRPVSFKLKNTQTKNAKGEWADDSGAAKQLSIIEHLFSDCSEIIVATDAGREGELIFRYIYQFTGCKKPFRRLWISSLTPKAIKEGFTKLEAGEKYDNLFYSAKSRSEADWLVGFNASIALSMALLRKLKVSLGRVQTPTLAMIVERYLQNKNFVPEPYFTVRIECSKRGQSFFADSDNFFAKDTVDKIYAAVQKANTASVVSIEKKEQKEQPPLLFDLTTLQRTANKKYAFSAAETLNIAQGLYEKGYISYPRTDSRYISKDVFELIPDILKVISEHPQYGNFAGDLKKLNDRCVDDTKISDHHALIPTEKYPSSLNDREEKIYSLVVKSAIEAFSPPCVKDTTKIVLKCAETEFKASGSIIKVAGWRALEIASKETDNDEEENAQTFPDLIQYENIPKQKEELLSKMTKPKPLHTEASLLAAMETCGKDSEDENIREAMKESGIGTPATRASIIEKLLAVGYMEREKKNLVPTPKGLSIYELVKGKPIASAELTGQWECRLNNIAKGSEAAKPFMDDIWAYTQTISAELLNVAPTLLEQNLNDSNKEALKCPKCGGVLRQSEKNWYCSNYKTKPCDFVVWKNIAGKKLTEANVKSLVVDKTTKLLSGFTSKAGKEFQAHLVINPETFKVEFQFEDSKKKK